MIQREYAVAFVVNALLCAGIFLVPSELSDRVLASVEVSISNFRLPDEVYFGHYKTQAKVI